MIGVVVGSVSVAAAQFMTVGSAGTVDEQSLAAFNTSGAQVRIQGTAPLPASVVIRYNVATRFLSGVGVALTARFRDNGAGARVVAVLKRVTFITGVTKTLLTLDSNDVAPSADLQTEKVSSCATGLTSFDHAYFIEATLSKTTGVANPTLQLLRLDETPC